TGSTFSEPGTGNGNIGKDIYSFTHVSGDKLGKNLVVAEVLQSTKNDFANGGVGNATEFYGLYRRTFSFAKMTGKPVSFGPVKDVSLVGRLDLQTKNISFAPRAKKLIGGVSFDFEVPKGFVESGIYAYSESNHFYVGAFPGGTGDVSFKTTYMLDTSWLIPFNAGTPAKWTGSLTYTGAKGKDGLSNDTKPETRLITTLMFDVGNHTGFAVGIGFEAWRNKYGNAPATTPVAGSTSHNTALLLAEYRF
ncbi:MAG: hypothetical protein ABIP46_04805, partial [Polaromonas sp.]